jgi:hypothetical protein
MFVSVDDGSSWQSLQNGLPPTSVRDIEIHGDDLVVATHGRSFYILDDFALLRSLAIDASGGPRLFPPAAAWRFRPSTFTGTPMPKDEPLAPNPPDGAMIDYVVPPRIAGPVRIAILDSHGSVVRRFSSDKPPPPPDLSKIKSTPDWIATPTPVRTTPGQHRFVWDLHYESELPQEEGERGPTGVWAPPGSYAIVLTMDGRALREPLKLNADPRVRASAANYDREFALARSIETARVQLRACLGDAKALHAKLTKAAARAGEKANLLALDKSLLAISDISANKADSYPPPRPHSLRSLTALSDAFEALADAVDGADGAPTADAEQGYHEHAAMLAGTLKTWSDLKTRITSALRS